MTSESDEFRVPLLARLASILSLLAAMIDATATLQLLVFVYADWQVIVAEGLQAITALLLFTCGASQFHGSLPGAVAGAVVGVGGGVILGAWSLFAACNGFLSPLSFLAAFATGVAGLVAAASIPGNQRLDAARRSAA